MNLGSAFTMVIRFMCEVLPSVGGFAFAFCRARVSPVRAAHLFFLSHLLGVF